MQRRALNPDEASALVLLAAILFGAWFRLMPAWLAGFPINDGGLFHSMIADIQANRYIPPVYASYNHAQIPFAYPPLGLYLGALISDLFNIPAVEVLRWLPGVINSLCIPALYLLAKEILNDKLTASIAAFVFAFIPHMTDWFSMGGGITRSLGGLFMLLTLAHAYRVFAHEDRKSIIPAAIFGSLAALSHTEAPVYTIAIAVFFWFMKSRARKGIAHGIQIALGVLLLAGGWFAWIIHSHGLTPFESAFQTGLHSNTSLLRILNIDFLTEEHFVDIIGVLGLLGTVFLIGKGDLLIPGMLFVIFLVQPRSAHTIGNIPLALAAGYFITRILHPPFQNSKTTPPYRLPVVLLVILPFIFSNSIFHGLALSREHAPEAEREAMEWIRQNTPPDAAFLVITGEPNPFCDSVGEWFPALTDRKSIATLQGREWTLGNEFNDFIQNASGLQTCLDKGLECLEQEAEALGGIPAYIYASLDPTTVHCNPAASTPDMVHPLLLDLERSPKYTEIYRSDAAIIFQQRQP